MSKEIMESVESDGLNAGTKLPFMSLRQATTLAIIGVGYHALLSIVTLTLGPLGKAHVLGLFPGKMVMVQLGSVSFLLFYLFFLNLGYYSFWARWKALPWVVFILGIIAILLNELMVVPSMTILHHLTEVRSGFMLFIMLSAIAQTVVFILFPAKVKDQAGVDRATGSVWAIAGTILLFIALLSGVLVRHFMMGATTGFVGAMRIIVPFISLSGYASLLIFFMKLSKIRT